MKKQFVCLILAFSWAAGCSYKIESNNFEEPNKFYGKVNELCKEKEDVTICTLDSQKLLAKDITILNDTIFYYDKTFYTNRKIATQKINKIAFNGTGTSVFEGFLFGSLIGGFTGNIVTRPHVPGLEAAGYTLGGILFGALTGIIAAVISPPDTEIIFNDLEKK